MRGRASHALASFALVVASVASCNVVSGLDRDYELAGPSGAGIDGSSAESGRAEGGVAAVDGESSVDAGADVDAGGPSGCPSQPLPGTVFCSDFEAPTSPWGWSSVANTGGAPAVEDKAGPDGSRALHAKMTATSTSRSASLWTTRSVEWGDGQTLSMSFWFRIAGASAYAAIGAVQFNDREHGLAVYPGVADCAGAPPCVDENDQQVRGHEKTGSFTYDPTRWYRAEVTLTRSDVSFGGSVSVDGNKLYSVSTGAIVGPAPSTIDIGVGAFYSGLDGSADVFIDDVLVRLLP